MKQTPIHAVHGGDFFQSIGDEFQHLDRAETVLNADVLDAWYDPAPEILDGLKSNLAWLIKSSPPVHQEGMVRVIAEERGVKEGQVFPGPGSSALMFNIFPKLILPGETAVILDPCYGEYPHVLEHVVGASIRRVSLDLDTMVPNLDAVVEACQGAKLFVLVNPNSPTGIGLEKTWVESLLARLSPETTVWIDETYIDFMPGKQSAEVLVAQYPNLIVSKSMSKFYSLSGLRVAYLVANPQSVQEWSRTSPPWSVGMIAQFAAITALRHRMYYAARAEETHQIRAQMMEALQASGRVHVYPSTANFIMMRLPNGGAKRIDEALREKHIYIRNCDSLSPRFQDDFIRVAVKAPEPSETLVRAILAELG